MVLCTRDSETASAWETRLPAQLPSEYEQLQSAKDRSYIPASAHSGIREKARHDAEAAVRMLQRWLERATTVKACWLAGRGLGT